MLSTLLMAGILGAYNLFDMRTFSLSLMLKIVVCPTGQLSMH